MRKGLLMTSICFGFIFFYSLAFAGGAIKKSKGQTLYVSTSYNCSWDELNDTCAGPSSFSRLIIRNVDPYNSITVTSIELIDPDGDIAHVFQDFPQHINRFSSISVLANNNTLAPLLPWPLSGGRPFFLVKWEAAVKVIPPLMGTTVVTPSGELLTLKGIVIDEEKGSKKDDDD